MNQNTIYEGHRKFYPQTTFRFLPEPEKSKIIVEAILDDPDKVADKEKTDYYLRKYNRDSKDEITKLIAECEKMEGKEDVTKLLQEALRKY